MIFKKQLRIPQKICIAYVHEYVDIHGRTTSIQPSLVEPARQVETCAPVEALFFPKKQNKKKDRIKLKVDDNRKKSGGHKLTCTMQTS